MSTVTHKSKRIFIILMVLIITITIWVLRTENISFSQSATKEHLPQIYLINDHNNNNNPLHMHELSRKLTDKLISNQEPKQYGIETAPYDLSKLHIYGENEYCHNTKYKNKIQYMDITGMYDTGTNTFYQVLTKNCWGIETKKIDYITAYLPKHATETEEKHFKAQADALYDSERPKVLEQVQVFRNVKWKPLTGKHHVISAEQDFADPEWSSKIKGIRNRLTLAIIKDPLTWFKSLCKAPYEVHLHSKKFRYRCPFGLSNENGKFSANMWHSVKFASLIELWNWWYGAWTDSGETISVNWKPTAEYWNSTISVSWREWMTQNFLNSEKKYVLHDVNQSRFDQEKYYKAAENIPHLVIRYEDILFQPEKLISKLCACAGGYVRSGGPVIQQSAAKGHGLSRGRKKALQTYGNPDYRFDGYSANDVKFMKETLNETLLNLFSYNL